LVSRTGLHYPAAFPTVLRAIRCGMDVGEQSGPYFMAKYEDVFHLPLAEAREALGIVGAVDLDSREASLCWDEYKS
jgi:ubiquinone biosynthesis protein Coq4